MVYFLNHVSLHKYMLIFYKVQVCGWGINSVSTENYPNELHCVTTKYVPRDICNDADHYSGIVPQVKNLTLNFSMIVTFSMFYVFNTMYEVPMCLQIPDRHSRNGIFCEKQTFLTANSSLLVQQNLMIRSIFVEIDRYG